MPKLWRCHLAILIQPLACLVFVLAPCVPVMAQGETTSAIVGAVTDPAGAAIPGATVTLTSSENGLRRSVKTDDGGRFSFPQLKPGMYSVMLEAKDFEAQQNNNLPAGLGQKQTVGFKL